MQQKRFENGKETYYYEIKDGKAHVTGFEGQVSRIELPSGIEGYPVAVIERKAFLSRKSLHAVVLPGTTEEIGDWAFAYCDNLTEISLPGKDIRFGRAAFKNCGKLKRIVARPCCGIGSAIAELLAAAVTMLDAYYLLDLPAAGSREWLEKWDSRLCSLLRTADQEGYISQSVYGEEDYIGTDLEEYVSARRKEKVRLAFLRLLHPQALPPELKEELEGYLRRLTKGREEEEAWQVLLQEHGGDREYYSLFAAISCVTEENLEGILADIGEEYPEMKAFFLTLDKSGGDGDFFAGLEL